MTKRLSNRRFDSILKYAVFVLPLGGIPLLFIHGIRAEVLFKAYVLTTFLLFILILSHWESTSDFWFWKAMVVVFLIHSGIAAGLVTLHLEVPQIGELRWASYGALASILGAECLVALRIIEVFRPKRG
jgi:hypothetical protein